jgi:hypothetical protein
VQAACSAPIGKIIVTELSIWERIASQATSIMFGAIGGGLVGALVAMGINALARRRERLALTVQLHELYVSPDFYSRVRAPSYHVGLQWLHLRDDVGQAYRDAVLSGWAAAENDDTLSRYVPDLPSRPEDIIPRHFHLPVGRALLTEHQALTAELRFWTRLNIHIQRKTVNRKVVKDLFSDEFGSHYEFLASFALAVLNAQRTRPPRWVKDIEQLARFFGIQRVLNKGVQPTAYGVRSAPTSSGG